MNEKHKQEPNIYKINKNNTMYKHNQWKEIACKKESASNYRLKQHKKT
jgi:hypothetical protein